MPCSLISQKIGKHFGKNIIAMPSPWSANPNTEKSFQIKKRKVYCPFAQTYYGYTMTENNKESSNNNNNNNYYYYYYYLDHYY